MKTYNLVMALVMTVAAAAWADTQIDEVRSAGMNDNVEIFNVKGWIELKGWDKQEVRVSGTLGKNVVRLDFNRDNDDTEIRVVTPKGNIRVGESNLTIQVPMTNRVRIECVSGSVKAQDIKANLELESVSGSVRATNCVGDIEAKSVSGSVKVLESAGNVRAQSVSGSVEVDGDFGEVEAKSTSGSVKVKTIRDEVRAASVSGSVEIEGITPREVECKSTSGSVSYSGGLAEDANVEMSSHSGSVKLRLPPGTSARVHAQSFSGGIHDELGGAEPERPPRGPGVSLNTKYGSGSADIEASSFSGSVTLEPK